MQAHLRLVPKAGFLAYDKQWCFDPAFRPCLLYEDGDKVYFDSALHIRRAPAPDGLGLCERTVYSGFEGRGGLEIETSVLVYSGEARADLKLTVRGEGEGVISEIRWPAPLICDGKGAYAVLNTMQGQLLPSDWPEAAPEKAVFDGHMCSSGAYMPWWGEIAPDGGYLAYVRTAWDCKYTVRHPAGGPTRVFARHLPSLGRMTPERVISYYFVPAGSRYTDLCRLYRSIADDEGRAVTLRQKAALNPMVDKLIGACVMHVPGKTHIVPDSRYYDREHPENNDSLTPFDVWEKRVRMLKKMGVDRLYLHQDGWGQPGYDNRHPDYLPPCEEMGGWEGMKRLSDTMRELGFMFGVHDQYRDYYLDAPTHDPDHAVRLQSGTVYEHAIWAGGKQNYLCPALAPMYVKRNFDRLLSRGIHLEGTYLDVFTCNEPDECSNPRHLVTRKECLEYRARCFHYLTARGIAPSSEEVNDWAMPSQVFCHWAPYQAKCAIPVPLFNLCYHDCVIIPWMMPAGEWGIPEGTTGFLQCLLNGGMGYMSETAEGEKLEENIRQWRVISELQRHVAKEKMTDHVFLSDDRARQQTVFSDGTRVTVDFSQNTYDIQYPEEK